MQFSEIKQENVDIIEFIKLNCVSPAVWKRHKKYNFCNADYIFQVFCQRNNYFQVIRSMMFQVKVIWKGSDLKCKPIIIILVVR